MGVFDKRNLRGFIGKHLVCTYDNGWNYEIYVKNDIVLDYRIHSGIVGSHWVKDQRAYIARVGENVYKISWTEPTGIDVSLIINPGDKLSHGTISFLRWVINNPEKMVYFQNDHIPPVVSCHDVSPVYPTEVTDEFVAIILVRDCGANSDDVIVCATSELPRNFPENLR